MQYSSIKLKSGVDLTLIRDRKFKTNTVSMTFLTGNDRAAASGSALLTGVLSRSCSAYPSLQLLNRALDDLYDAQLTTDTVRRGLSHAATFSVCSLDNRYSPDGTDISGGALSVLENVIFSPSVTDSGFSPEIFEGEREQLKDAINAAKNSRSSYAVKKCMCDLMRREPGFSPRLGFVEDADALTPEGLYGFYKKMLKNAPVRITAVLSDGADRVTEFAQKAAERLGDRPDGFITGTEYTAPPKRLRRVTETSPVRQDVICVGCDLDCSSDDGREAQRALFNEILFQNPTSRLFTNVRERLSLCYFISAAPMTDLKKYIIYAGIDGRNAKKAETEIIRQLTLLRSGVSEEELRICKLALKNDLLSITDSPSRLLSWYLSRSLHGVKPISIQDYISVLEPLTSDDVAEAACAVTPDTVYLMKGGAQDEI